MEKITGSTKQVVLERFEYVHVLETTVCRSGDFHINQSIEVPGPIFGSKTKHIQWSLTLTPYDVTVYKSLVVANCTNTSGKDENLQVELTVSSSLFNNKSAPATVTFEKSTASKLTFNLTRANKYPSSVFTYTFKFVVFQLFTSAAPVRSPLDNMPLEKLQASLKSMLDNGDFADVTISTSDGTICAHKCFLAAQSPVFRAMFSTEMLEAKNSTLEIIDFDKNIVSAMLEHIYTGFTDEVTKNPQEMLQIADKYELDELKKTCIPVVTDTLTTDNAISNLLLADRLGMKELKGIVMQFFKANHLEIAKCENYKEFVNTNYELFLEALNVKPAECN